MVVDYMKDMYDEYVHLVRLALEGQQRDVIALAKRNLKQINKSRPDLADLLKNILADYNSSARIVRQDGFQPLPVDVDSKQELLRKDYLVFDTDPIWPESVMDELKSVIEERKHQEALSNCGLSPTRSILFVGPPGVGKTLAASWLAFQLNRPLLTLDLAAVMSSYLGRTGNNIRAVLNYAIKNSSILLLDEFDAIAKRRNDDSDVGELKRLVNVILQTIDDWPSQGILIAATNHPDLLDPAVWRRFERIVEFPNPSVSEIHYTLDQLLDDESSNIQQLINILAMLFEGSSYAEVVRQINICRRDGVIKNISLESSLEELALKQCKNFDRNKRTGIAIKLLESGISQRRVSEVTGISRDTLRKHTQQKM